MENKILDDLEEPKKAPYAKKSFLQFCIVAFIYLLFFSNFQMFAMISTSTISFGIIILVLIGTIVLPVLGMLNGLKSIRREENSTWRKYIGVFGNILLLFLIVVILISVGVDIFENFIVID